MKEFPFQGLNLALATPFTEHGAVDFAKLEHNLERYISAGVKAFVLSSGTGMHVYLSRAESHELIEQGAKIINGRAKIIAQASALMMDDVIENVRHAKGSGADGVMILPPYFEGPTDDDEIVDFYAKASSAGLPVIGYNVPQSVGVAVTPALLNRLMQIPGFCAVKDSGGDMSVHAALIATGHPVMNGADQLVPYSLYAGCSGLIWGGANFAPKTCLAIAQAAAKKDWHQVLEIWKVLEPIMALISERDYVKSVYAASQVLGYDAGSPRRPLAALSGHRVDEIRTALKGLIAREAA